MFVRRVGFELVCFPEIHGTRGARKYTYTDVDWRKIRPILAENLVKTSSLRSAEIYLFTEELGNIPNWLRSS